MLSRCGSSQNGRNLVKVGVRGRRGGSCSGTGRTRVGVRGTGRGRIRVRGRGKERGGGR